MFEKESAETSIISNLIDENSLPYKVRSNYTMDEKKLLKDNSIETSKYNWYNCVPKILIEQFSKMANIYFLIIAILQSINYISISNGKPIILLPLSFVIILNGLKDILEDLKRKYADNKENNNEVKKYENQLICTKWMDLKKGDIVKIHENEFFPADLLIIASSENNMCFVETKSLDGETNLKYKYVDLELSKFVDKKIISNIELNEDFLMIECKRPNDNIFDFTSKVLFEDKTVLLNKDSALLRGCCLKQTSWVYGIVIYVGNDTKVMKNSTRSFKKLSKLEKQMHQQILFILLFQISISILATVCSLIWFNSNFEGIKSYIFMDYNNEVGKHNLYFNTIFNIGTWILIFTNLVPISLLVTMEFIKFIQGMFISWDTDMYDKKTKSVLVQSSTLNEELGQVDYVFTDKTGTLTKNIMEFKSSLIGNKFYDCQNLNHSNECNSEIFKDLKNNNHVNNENVKMFATVLALCHSADSNVKGISDFNKATINYKVSSPDELAMLNFVKNIGYTFAFKKGNSSMTININGNFCEYKIFDVIEYSSERKRMSIIVFCPLRNKYFVLTKGADSYIIPKSNNLDYFDFCNSYLHEFAKKGLRTLTIAYKEISLNEINEYLRIKSSCNINEIDKINQKIESGYTLLGCTAVEDYLQDNVKETLIDLINAGIKIIMLTGDKIETAKTIGFSCGLIDHYYRILEIEENISSSKIESDLLSFNDILNENYKTKFALIIGHEELNLVLKDEGLKTFFHEVASKCNSVLCCRSTPKQKSSVVKLFRNKEKDKVTLAIGDGANDVCMITSSHVGIGISGLEGEQASRAADYSIGQFKYLKKLLFVHGRESYRKNCFVVCYNFYKNSAFVMPQFFFGFVSIFSGQSLYDPWIYQLFNIIFAFAPIVYYGCLDTEFSHQYLINNSKILYRHGLENRHFNIFEFWKYLLISILQSFLIFLFVFLFSQNSIIINGVIYDMWSNGSICYYVVVIVINVKVLMHSKSHSYYSFALVIITILSYLTVIFVMSTSTGFENFGHFNQILIFNVHFNIIMLSIGLIIVDYALDNLLNKLYYNNNSDDILKIDEKDEIDEKINLMKTIDNNMNDYNEDLSREVIDKNSKDDRINNVEISHDIDEQKNNYNGFTFSQHEFHK